MTQKSNQNVYTTIDGAADNSRPWTAVILFALGLAVSLPGLDITIAATAAPTIVKALDAFQAFSWIGAAYMLGSCATTTLWAGLSATFGSKRLVLAADVLFAVGSLLNATAQGVPQLICGRAIQGIGAGGLMVLVNVIIGQLFAPKERGRYYAWTGMAFTIGLGCGPFIGGLLTDKASWRWCFYINLPLDLIVFGLLWYFLDSDKPRGLTSTDWRDIDWLGSILMAGGVVMLLLGLNYVAGSVPWTSPKVWALLLFSALCFMLFLLNEWRYAARPLVSLRTLGNVTTSACLVISFCHGFVLISGMYYLAYYFNTFVMASPLQVGVYLLPTTVTIALVTLVAGHMVSRTGKPVFYMIAGAFLMTLGYGLFIVMTEKTNWPSRILPQIVAGAGAALLFYIPLTVMQASVPPAGIATATGTYSWARMLAMSLSLVISDTVLTAAQKNPEICDAVEQSSTQVSRECTTHALMYVWILLTVVVSFCLWAAFAILGGSKLLGRARDQLGDKNTLGEADSEQQLAKVEEQYLASEQASSVHLQLPSEQVSSVQLQIEYVTK